MKGIDEVLDELDEGLEDTMQITAINGLVIDAACSIIDSLGSVKNKFGGNASENQKKALEKIRANPKVSKVIPIVYGQQIILMISAFETYVRALIRLIAEEYPQLFDIKGDSAKIDLEEVFSEDFSRGSLVLSILAKRQINFQDLQSIKRDLLKGMLKIDLDKLPLGEYEKQYILASAIRHVLVHNKGVANREFINNIRLLDPKVQSAYKLNKAVKVSEEDVINTRDAIRVLAYEVALKVEKRVDG